MIINFIKKYKQDKFGLYPVCPVFTESTYGKTIEFQYIYNYKKQSDMTFFRNICEWFSNKKDTDIEKVTVTSSGAFYMKSEDLFDDDNEALALLDKLDKAVKICKGVNGKVCSHFD